jgi:preprotein translocase subunit SecE
VAERPFFKPENKAMGIFTKLKTYLLETFLEIRKVNWPTRQEAINYTLIVLGISVGVAVYLGGLDYIITNILTKFIFRG